MDCLQLPCIREEEEEEARRRRSRFVNSAFSNKKILAQKSKFIYDKQI